MSEQVNIRGEKATMEAFRRLCEEQGLTQSETFEALVAQAAQLSEAGTQSKRQAEVEHVERLVESFLTAYKGSIDLYMCAEDRAKKNYEQSLLEKQTAIENLTERVSSMEAELDGLRTQLEAAVAERDRLTAEVEDKKLIASLYTKLEAENETLEDRYVKLEEKYKELEGKYEALETPKLTR